MPKRIQYDSYVDATGDRTGWAEQVSVDRFIGYQPPPQANWQKAALYSVAAIAPFLFFVNTVGNATFPERVHPEATQALTSQPVLPKPNRAYLEPASNFVQAPSEIITVDKWHPLANQPVFKVANITYTYPVAVQDTRAMTQVERATPDKWLGSHPDIVFDVKRQQYLYPTFATSAQAMTQPERSTPDKWTPQIPAHIDDVKRTQYSYPFFTADTLPIDTSTIELDKFDYQESSPVWDVKRQQYLYPTTPTIDTTQLTKPERTTPDKWTGSHPDVVFDTKRLQYSYPTLAFCPELVPSEEVVTLDKWQGQKPDLVFDLKRLQFSYPSYTADTLPLDTSTLDLERFDYQESSPVWDVKRQQYLYPSTPTIDSTALTRPERTSPDRYMGYQPALVWDLKRAQYTYPALALDPFPRTGAEIVTVDKWLPQLPAHLDDVKRQQYLAPTLAQFPGVIAEAITVDKWFVPTAVPVLGVQRQQYTDPSFAIDQAALTRPETPQVDKWAPQYPAFIRKPANASFTQDNLAADPVPPLRVAVDQWFTRAADPVRVVPRWQYLYPVASIDPTALLQHERITLDKWQPQYPHKLWDSRRLQYGFPSLFTPTELVVFVPLPPPTRGMTTITLAQASGGATASRLGAATGGATTGKLGAAIGGSTAVKLTTASGGSTTAGLAAPTGGTTIY